MAAPTARAWRSRRVSSCARGEAEAIYDHYTPGADDYTALVAQLHEARIEVLYIGGYGPDAGLILRTARERGDDLQLVGGDALGMAEFWTVAGKDGEGAIYSGRSQTASRHEATALLERFRARGLGTQSSDLGPYAAVQVWAQAVARVGTLDLAPVVRALRRGRFDSVLGRLAFDRKGDLKGAAWRWKVWTDGVSVPIDLVAATQ